MNINVSLPPLIPNQLRPQAVWTGSMIGIRV